MNILSAKEEVKKTISIYLDKDEYGNYRVIKARQRPIFLIGAPGIGKTAIMSQIAAELNIGLVSYTITHHTRQSAIGLPFIQKKKFGDTEFSITEYTLSEIIASVYEAIENQSTREGILFIDEINCVSETLAPSMLELLQNKKFGPHDIPPGWILVSAGNPPEYNQSVREFDVVTLDRLKLMRVDPDYDVWKKYAYRNLFEDSILFYLQINPQSLFVMEKTIDGIEFSTPRGWEDLSVAIQQYRSLGFDVNIDLILQYIQNQRVAKEFFRYFNLYSKYKEDYNVTEIIEGQFEDKIDKFKKAKFDEKLAIVEVFVSKINNEVEKDALLSQKTNYYKQILQHASETANLKDFISSQILLMQTKLKNNALSVDDKKKFTQIIHELSDFLRNPTLQELEKLKIKTEERAISNGNLILFHLENLISFIDKCFGTGQEMVAFLVNLISSYHFVVFISTHNSPTFLKLNDLLLVDKQNQSILKEIEEVKEALQYDKDSNQSSLS